MKKQIRCGVFETNSSSCHSITMCMKSDYDRWEKDELYLYTGLGLGYTNYNKPKENHFYTREEAIAFVKTNRYVCKDTDWSDEEVVDEILHNTEFFDYEYFWDECCKYYETYEEEMVTPNGENIVAFGYYGHD